MSCWNSKAGQCKYLGLAGQIFPRYLNYRNGFWSPGTCPGMIWGIMYKS